MKLRRSLAWLLFNTAIVTIAFGFAINVSSPDWWRVVLVYVGVSVIAAAQLVASVLFFLEADALA